MAGLMSLFSRHSGFILTLGYIRLNLALIGSRRGISECEELGCAEGPGGAWSALADAEPWARHRLGPGNTNKRVSGDGWVGTRYTPPRYPPSPHHPGYYLPTDTA